MPGSFGYNGTGQFKVPSGPTSTSFGSVSSLQALDDDDVLRFEIDTDAGTVKVFFQNEGTGSFSEITGARIDSFPFDSSFGVRPAVSNFNNSIVTLQTGGQTTLSNVTEDFKEINQEIEIYIPDRKTEGYGPSKKGFEKQKKAAAAGVDDYIRKLDKESVNEISFSHVSTQKLVKSYKQMADERLSGAAALTFRLIAKELKKRKVKLPESVNEDWWSEMSSYDQAQYIKDHPNSAKAKSSKKARKEKEADRKKLAKRGYDIDATTGKAVKQSKKEDPKKKEKHKKAISKGIFPGSPEYSKFMKEAIKESTKSWNKSLEKIARDRQLKSISKKDRETLMRIAQMMKKANESVNEKVIKVSKKDDVPGNAMKMSGEEKIKKLVYSGSNGKGSYEIKGKNLNVNGIRPRDKGFFVRHFTMKTGFRKANLYYDGVNWMDKNKKF